MKVRWTKRALIDLQKHHDWLSTLPRAKPDETIQRIEKSAAVLTRLGDIGRPSSAHGQRELSVRRAPYVILYELKDEEIEILAVYHTAQDRK